MTDEQATALGKRLVACKGFRPMRGMLDMQGRTWDQSLLWRWSNDVDVPDLRDPATLGCLLALVREAWGDDAMIVARIDVLEVFIAPLPGGYPYEVMFSEPRVAMRRRFGSEVEALVAALEAAP